MVAALLKYLARLGLSFLIFLALLVMLPKAHALEGLVLQELSIDYKNYSALNPKARNLLIYPEFPKEGINVGIKTTLFGVFYWDSTIESLTTSAQYRAIGLQTGFGLRFKRVDIGAWHHSQHCIDRECTTLPKFPSEDAIHVKLYIYRRGE
jgi:hypothetical protein